MASRSLGSLTVDIIAKVGGFTKGMTQAERQADKSSKAIEQRMRRLGKGIDAALQIAGAAALAATAAITVGVGNAINRLDEIGKASQKVGVTTEALSKLAYAARLADVDFQALQGGLIKLAKSQDAAAQGSAAQLDLFRALGVEFQNQDGTLRNTADVLSELADKFQALPDGADKTTAALTLLGKSGANLIPLLNGGSEAIRDAGDELERMGGVVTPEAAAQAEIFNDNITRLKTALEGMWQSLAMQVLPALVKLTEDMTKATTSGQGMNTVVEAAASLVNGLGLAAQLAVDGVQALTLSAIGLFNVLSAMSRLNVTGLFRDGSVGEDMDNAAAAFGLAKGAFAESGQNFYGGAGATAQPMPTSGGGGSPNGRGRGVKVNIREEDAAQALAAALRAQREAAAAAATAKTASAEASRGMAAADREAAQALREQAEQRGEAYDEIQRVYKAEQQDLADIAEAKEKAKEIVDQTLADIAFETKLLGLNNLEREKAITLRWANVDAASEEGKAISAALDDLEEAAKRTDGIEFARDATKGLFEDLTDGVGSARDAVDDFFDNLRAKAFQALADKLFDGLFDSFLGGGEGGGGGIGDFLGSLFGGARAGGGPVYPGKAYLVGEEGPELIRPMGAGMVSTAGETARMSRGGAPIINNFNMPGRYDLRTQAQIATDAGRSTQRALARGTA